MKRLLLLLFFFSLTNCSSSKIVENWKNPNIDFYEPHKVLIVGMTPNTEARLQFENQIKEEYENRGIEATISLDLFEPTFITEKKSEAELKQIENTLIENGYDTVLFTKIVGVEDKVAYYKNYGSNNGTYKKFNEDYIENQDIYYNTDYYENYKVFHAETSLYCLCPTKDRELIWKGFIDITNPETVDKTVTDYVELLLFVLEEQHLIETIINK
jgi:hypothetical protein